ncbi:DUF58 domain-containing protein [Desulfovibrio inopinatus]|uniref:DUF58 domain-containing protein n=1 Tax=Desulfovibrio inopinatus TaxID=102109 RepID=UPI0003F78781|nr:DUF58 domain-containing protein [Desulfovibrio inopinatus]
MISPPLYKQLRRIHLRGKRISDALMAGHFRSVFRGHGVEFEEVGVYDENDDVKHIEWNVTARMGRPFVKRYREEREQTVMLLVDTSASLGVGHVGHRKLETAAETAALLALCAQGNGDAVGAMLFSESVEMVLPAKKTQSAVWRIVREIVGVNRATGKTSLRTVLEEFGRMHKRRAIVFLISDFADTGYMDALRPVAGRHDLVAVMVHDPLDFDLPEAGIVHAVDPETHETVVWDCFDAASRRRFHTAAIADFEQRQAELRAAGVDIVECSTDASPVDALYRFFRLRERRLGR